MKKFKVLCYFLPILFLPLFFRSEPRMERRPASKTISKKSKSNIQRIDHFVKKVQILSRIPQSVKNDFEVSEEITIPGYELITNVGAVAKKDYVPAMGETIYRDAHFNFVKVGSGHQLLPVALSKSTGKLHPISYVLHIKKVTADVREALKNAGYKEYYYHQGMKLLSVESSPSLVLKDYLILKNRGFAVQLEVLGPRHQQI